MIGISQKALQYPSLKDQRSSAVFPEMTVIASDPIGAFQVISDYCLKLRTELDELKAEVAALKGDS